jgi:hypothetical protein
MVGLTWVYFLKVPREIPSLPKPDKAKVNFVEVSVIFPIKHPPNNRKIAKDPHSDGKWIAYAP